MPPDPIRLYLDEDTLSRSFVSALRSRGVNVLTAHEADMGGRSDLAHLEFAASTSRTVLTCNVGDFAQLHNEFMTSGRQHNGILVTAQLPVGTLLRRSLKLMHALTSEDMRDRLEFLSNWR